MIRKKGKINMQWVQRAFIILIIDVISVAVSYFAALWMRFDFSFASIPALYLSGYIHSILYWMIVTPIVFYCFSLYHSIWRFIGLSEAIRIVWAYITLIVVYVILILAFSIEMPRSYYVIGLLLNFVCTVGIRFSFRIFRSFSVNHEFDSTKNGREHVMVIGAGQAGKSIIHELNMSAHLNTKVCCIIDDNENKVGRFLEGVPIVGLRDDIIAMVKKYHITRIIYAIPANTGQKRKEILNICKETGCQLQTVPALYQLVNGEVHVSSLRNVEIQDLLGRAQIKVNNNEIIESISGKTVMVTGGGGSIGSELCRQIIKGHPRRLIIFDIYENNAYNIQMELKREYPNEQVEALIGSVRNTNRVNSVMEQYRPDIIFHAAAHKHVPLMEDSPNEAIKNNVIGTWKVAQAAAKYGVKKFLLISTDKAVNPTNIMGASKRLCEMVVQMMNRTTDTDFVAVRFGNVLGSNGSVIPLFKEQIAKGGPVTVTDPNIIRYFMTIPEAVSLILQASYYAKGGEIFILDMGEPVKIDDMARNLIKLSGYEPDVDIPIVYTGLRPGEKLYEELLMSEEGMQDTANSLIHIGHPIEMDDELFVKQLERLKDCSMNESKNIKEIVAEVVPTYHEEKN